MSGSAGKSGILRLLCSSWRLLIKRCPKEAVLIFTFALGGSALAGAVTYFWRMLFEETYALSLGRWDLNRFVAAFGLLFAARVVQRSLQVVERIYQPAFVERVKMSLLAEIHDQADLIPLEHYENPSLYDTMHRAHEIVSSGRFMRFFLNGFAALSQGITVVSVCLVLASFSPWLIPICLVSVVPTFAARLIRGTRYYYMKVYQTPRIRIRDYLWSLLTSKESVKEIKTFGCGDYLQGKWWEQKERLEDEEWRFVRKQGWIQLAVDCSRILGLGLGIACLVWLMLKDALDVGAFGAGFMALQTVQDSFGGFLIQLSLASEKVPFVCDFFRFLGLSPAADDSGCRLGQLTEGITLDGVSFSYPGTKRAALENIDLHIRPGETVALVGANGAGKTTLAKLILGLYRPTEGTIMYNGRVLSDYEARSVYRRVSAVFQDYTRYQLTLRENVGFGDMDRMNDDSAILSALQRADFADIVQKLPAGLDSHLGREFGGTELSGGEWQRVAIARGVIRDGDVIVLDEPTASLDPVTEADIFRRFARLVQGQTAVLVSHRIGSVRMADRIVVLAEGRIVEQGTHEELLRRKGTYHKLFNLQAQWYR